MSGPVGSSQWMYASGDFTIDQSLRFNDASVPELLFSPSSTGNRKTWTMSLWAKRSSFSSTHQVIFEARDGDSGSSDNIKWENEQLCVILQDGTLGRLKSTAAFRDVSAWYHIVVAVDTTQATNTNRIKVYVNNVQLTSFTGTNTYPSQNDDTRVNWSSSDHQFGNTRHPDNDHGLHGYLAEIHMIDGTALTPSSFAETDDDYGHWKPKQVAGLTYGTNGYYLNFAGGGIIAATGGTITTDGDYKVHSFTANGTFTVTSVASYPHVEYLVVAGGGGAGGASGKYGSGGGAGGMRTGVLTVTDQAYSITVGGGGGVSPPEKGSNSVFSTITSTGGGRGPTSWAHGTDYSTDLDGGSGGGTGTYENQAGGSGIAGQGNDGGTGSTGAGAGGGGGAGAVGGAAGATSGTGGAGGAGLVSYITGSSVTYAGGGGGSGWDAIGSHNGGAGGGGRSYGHNQSQGSDSNGTANTGGGGGGGSNKAGGTGGSGIVIIRYKFQ